MTADDGLAALLAEHGTADYDGDHFYCVGCTETLAVSMFQLDLALAAHVAAVVRAAGWVKIELPAETQPRDDPNDPWPWTEES